MLKMRNAGIDLLKIVAILLIIISHIVQTLCTIPIIPIEGTYLINLENSTNDVSILILGLLRGAGALGNNIFFACSVYFLIDSKRVKKEKIISLLSDVWFISIIIFSTFYIVVKIITPPQFILLSEAPIPFSVVIQQFLPSLFANNWYISCYIIFYPTHVILNKIIDSFEQRQLLSVSLILFIIYVVLNFLHSFLFPSLLILWLTIYFVVAYLKRYMTKCMDSIKLNLVLLSLAIFGQLFIVSLTNYLGFRIDFFYDKLLHWIKNENPFYIIMAISSLNIARKLNIRSGLITKISSLSLLIYIIHENFMVRNYIRPVIWSNLYNMLGHEFILLQVIGFSIILFIVSIFLGVLYQSIFQKHVHKIGNHVGSFISRIWGKGLNLIMRLS